MKYSLSNILTLGGILLLAACNEQPHNVTKPASKHHTSKGKLVSDTITITAVGDMMLGTAYPTVLNLPADSGKNSLKAAEKYLKDSDVTFGNLEGAIADSGVPLGRKKLKPYSFRMPVKYAGLFKAAGFKVLSIANNHIDDFGDLGRKSTVQVLDSLGINHAGLQTNPKAIFTINGVKYGFCAFAPNTQVVSLHDFMGAANIIKELKQQVDIVIVSFHGGGEGVRYEHVPFKKESFMGENRGDVHAFAHNAIDAGADVIFGNGPHVSRAIEIYNKHLIAYSLGNFCTYKRISITGACGLAPLLKVKLNKKGEFLNGRIISFIQSHKNGLQCDTINRAATRIKYLTETDFPQSSLTIANNGTITLTE